MSKKGIACLFFCLICLGLALSACAPKGLDEQRAGALAEAFGDRYTAEEIVAQSLQKLEGERAKKFRAIKAVVKLGADYGFIAEPVGYNGPILLAVAIDGATGKTAGLRIISHDETDHYVRDMESEWFISRFAGKAAAEYLRPVRLNAGADNEIVCITGATVSTEAVINGVNAAMGLYRELALGETAPDVAYAVEFERSAEAGPVENGRLAIRAEGVVLGEITLERIKELPAKKRTMSIHSTQGTTTHAFRGALLSDILNEIDPELTAKYDMAMAVGVDDYISGIRMEEILAENSVFVMYEDNGQPLERMDGGEGGMRVIVTDDIFGQRFTNYLLEIALE